MHGSRAPEDDGLSLIDSIVRAQMLAPSPATSNLVGIAGRTRQRFEDFVVDEVPAYGADGREGRHLLIRVRKRGLSTPDLVRQLSSALRIDSQEIGVAGRKDRDAVTSQWLSVPFACAAAVDALDLDGVEILEVSPHGQKLRMGHLRANRFRIVIREPGGDLETARHHVRDKLIFIERNGGLENLYGGQRFGHGGENLDRGFSILAADRSLRPPDKFLVSAAQAGMFNLYVALRKEQGWLRQVLPGDVLQRRETGGLFLSEDPAADQPRLERGELVLSGPIFGAKMRAPLEPSPSALLEQEVLRRSGLDPGRFRKAGKRLPGSRRPVQVAVSEFRVEEAPPAADLSAGLELRFTLPAGSYATQLLRELQCGPGSPD
jgi:tRNA pseudouridine13 synthase